MRHRQEALGIEFFSFNDLSITTRIAWFEEFVDALIEADLGTHWAVPAGIRAQRLSYDLLVRAKRSGMTHLQIAPETGSAKVLEWIDKRFDRDSVEETVVAAKRAGLPVCAYFIVGHPGETEADFQATMDLVRAVGFAQAYSFKYSPRPGTPAAGAPAQVLEQEKDRRLQALQALLREQQARFYAGCVGLTLPVLFTGPGRHSGQIAGRSPFLQPVHVSADTALIGREMPVRITAAHPNSLAGTLTQERLSA